MSVRRDAPKAPSGTDHEMYRRGGDSLVANRLAAGLARLACVLALASGIACGRPVPDAQPSSASLAATEPCQAESRGVDVSTWRQIDTPEFTFCVPSDWNARRGGMARGTARIEWGPIGRPRAVGLATAPIDVTEEREFQEQISGEQAVLWQQRLAGKYHTGITWKTRRFSLSGEADRKDDVELQFSIYRTVRFRR